MPVETIATDYEQESSTIHLAEKFTEEEKEELKSKAENYIYSGEARSGGRHPKELLSIIRNAVDRISEDDTDRKIKKAVGEVRGFTGELISKSLGLSECETIYGARIFIPNSEIVDPYDFFNELGSSRKDIALLNYYFNKEAHEIVPKQGESGFITADEIETLKKDTISTLINYDEIERKWVSKNPQARSGVTRDELIRWNIKEQEHGLEGKKKSTQNRLLNEALKVTSNKYNANIKNLIEHHAELPYEATTLPDAFLKDRQGKIVGAVEVKSYTPQEVKDWIKSLQQTVPLELDNFGASWQEKSDKAAEAALYERKGSALRILNEKMEWTGMTLGVDFGGIRNFLNVANNETLHESLNVDIDLVNDSTGEITQEKINFEYPVVVRLPDDIPNEDILELGALFEEFGIKNVCIQKMPLTSKELNQVGHGMYHKFGDSPEMGRVMKSIDPAVTSALKLAKTWAGERE